MFCSDKFDFPEEGEDLATIVRLMTMDEETLERHLGYTKLYKIEEDDPSIATSASESEEEPPRYRVHMDRQPLPPNVRPPKQEDGAGPSKPPDPMKDELNSLHDYYQRQQDRENNRQRTIINDEREFERSRPYRNQPSRQNPRLAPGIKTDIPIEFRPRERWPSNYLDIDCVRNRESY